MTSLNVLSAITSYLGNPLWLILSILSLVYLLWKSDARRRKKAFLVIVFTIICIANEASYQLLKHFMESGAYYRFFWVMPYVLFVAFALTRFIIDYYKTNRRLLAIVLCGIVLGLTVVNYIEARMGREGQWNYIVSLYKNPPENKYLLSDDVLQIAYILDEERKAGYCEEQPTVAYPMRVAYEYPSYDASVLTPTSRDCYYYAYEKGQTEGYETALILAQICTDNAKIDAMKAKQAIIENEVDYIVVNANADMESYMDSLDLSYVVTTDSYVMYRVNHNYYDAVSDQETVERIIEDTGINIRDISISLSGEYQVEDLSDGQVSLTCDSEDAYASYMILNDMHMLLTTDDTTEDSAATIQQRFSDWALTSTGVHSADSWQDISAILDYYKTDGILMAGDMVDFASSTNYRLFEKGLQKITSPILYVRADHDVSPWYNSDNSYTYDDAYAAQESLESGGSMTEVDDLMIWEEDSYIIMGWNNSCNQMTETGLETARKILSEGKPVILLTHVPLDSYVSDGLNKAARDFDPEGRAKLWGQDCLYKPNDVTGEFLDLLTAENSPLCAVISGHLHFEYTTMLTDSVVEYVLAPSFEGNIARLKIME